LRLCAGDWVEVLSEREILDTLDQNGMVDHLPFMPEMLQFCGRTFKIFKRAHKTCDSPHGLGARRMERAIHLDGVRCDGQAHGGCQAGCLIFWKEAWLKPLKGLSVRSTVRDEKEPRAEADPTPESPAPGDKVYICQSTELSKATRPWYWWDLRQYREDYSSGNVRLLQMLASFFFFLYSSVAGAGLGLGSGLRWIYDRFQGLRGGTPYPWRTGHIAAGTATLSCKLDLQPGEWVRVKSYPEILATLDEHMHNRGMYFDGEMVPYTGKTFQVLARVDKIIDERTGKLTTIKSDAVILENVTCLARYSKCRTFCSRSIFPFWREVWLERIDPNSHQRSE
jgi:hypothetical protein